MTLHRPSFQSHVRREVVDDEGVFLLSEKGATVLGGRLPRLVAPLVDGRRSVDEIVDALADRVSAAEVYYTLGELERQRHLVEAPSLLGRGEAAWWSSNGIDPDRARECLGEAGVAVTTLGDLDAEPLQELLGALGVAAAAPNRLRIVVTDDYVREPLAAINREALSDDVPWLLLKPVGAVLWLGPLLWAGSTACWECLAQRLRGNRAAEMHARASRGGMGQPLVVPGSTPTTFAAAWNLAAVEATRWIVCGESACEGTLVTMEALSGATGRHVVVRRPQCPACGEPHAGRPAIQKSLASGPKAWTWGGGHRVASPEQTLERLEHHVSPLTGVVTRLERSAASVDGLIHLYSASFAFPFVHESLDELRNALARGCSGKGASDAEARVSGLCEALERYSAMFTGDEPRRRASMRELRDAAIDPESCVLFSDRQYNQRDEWNARHGYFCRVPPRWDPDRRVDWSPAWSLTGEEVRYLPTGLCYLGLPAASGEQFVQTSNGLAAGNTVEEAVLHGFLELVERDGSAIWWYNRLPRPAVDWESFDNDDVRRVARFLEVRARSLWVLDLTGDLGIPTFVALSRRVDGGPERVVMGFGAHLDAAAALVRAVTELTQMLAWVLTDTLDEEVPTANLAPTAASWLARESVARQPYLAPDPEAPARQAADFPRLWSDDVRDDVLYCAALAKRLGLEVLVLDLTRPDIALPVVRVVVPGLRPLWARLAPGRLYDVPVQQGWLARQLREEELNPIPMFL